MGDPDRRAAWGVVLVLVGLVFLADRALGIDFGERGWPFIIVGVGAAFVLVGLSGLDPTRASVIPGSVVFTVGLILLYQNTYDHWESWAYAWALIPGSVGLGRALHARLTGLNEVQVGQGLSMAGGFAVLFVIGVVFFEGLLNISGRGSSALVDYALPVGLILLGAWMLAGRVWRRRGA
jgi:hypothetical protein